MGKKRRKLAWPFILLFRIIVIAAAASLIMSYLSLYISPSVSVIPLFFGLYFIPLVFLNLIILLFGVARRAAIMWVTFIALLPSILFAEMFVRWGDVEKCENGNSVKICSYNVGLFSQGKGIDFHTSIRGVSQFLSENNVDIACLQEFFITDTASIKKYFPGYPYYYMHLFKSKRGAGFGNITLSKFPIEESEKIRFDKSTNLCIYTDILINGKRVRIYNTHLESHSISFTALIKRFRESENMTNEIYDVHDKLAFTFRKRSHQVDSIIRHTFETRQPIIICGDLNDTPMSYTYKSLTSNRKDSFRQAGKGFSATYSFLWPMLRIDYILYPKTFWSLSHTTPRIKYSDHYPVISEIIIP